jgi:protein-export membrane protein SecD
MKLSKIAIASVSLLSVFLLLPAAGCGPSQNEQAKAAVEKNLRKLYRAMGELDLHGLQDLVSGSLEEKVKEADNIPVLMEIMRGYKEFEVAVDNVDVDEAQAEVVLTLDEVKLKQNATLKLDGVNWKVSKLEYDISGISSGYEFVASVHVDEALENELDDIFAEFRQSLEERNVAVAGYNFSFVLDDSLPYKQLLDFIKEPPFIEITFPNGAGRQEASDVIAKIMERYPQDFFTVDTDESAKLKITFLPAFSDAIGEAVMNQMRHALFHRIVDMGLPIPAVIIQGDPADSREILVYLPGVGGLADFKQRMQPTARFEFRLVVDDRGQPLESPSREELLARLGGQIPVGTEIVPQYEDQQEGRPSSERVPTTWYLLYRAAPVNGRYLTDAEVISDSYGQPAISIKLNAEGGERLKRATGANIGKKMAIVLDDEILMAARIESEIADECLISGRFSKAEADRIAFLLKTFTLPAGFHFTDERQFPAELTW